MEFICECRFYGAKPKERNRLNSFFLIIYYTYLPDKINRIFPIFEILLKFYHIPTETKIAFVHKKISRVCLENAFCKMCVTVCVKFVPDEGVVAGYDNRIRVKSPAKWGVQIAGMIFQTRSNMAHANWRPDSCRINFHLQGEGRRRSGGYGD